MTHRRADAMNQNMLFANIGSVWAEIQLVAILFFLFFFIWNSQTHFIVKIEMNEMRHQTIISEFMMRNIDKHRRFLTHFFFFSLPLLVAVSRCVFLFLLLIYRVLIWLMDFTLACLCQQITSSISMYVIVISRIGRLLSSIINKQKIIGIYR